MDLGRIMPKISVTDTEPTDAKKGDVLIKTNGDIYQYNTSWGEPIANFRGETSGGASDLYLTSLIFENTNTGVKYISTIPTAKDYSFTTNAQGDFTSDEIAKYTELITSLISEDVLYPAFHTKVGAVKPMYAIVRESQSSFSKTFALYIDGTTSSGYNGMLLSGLGSSGDLTMSTNLTSSTDGKWLNYGKFTIKSKKIS